MSSTRILVLGGTTEARRLAQALAARPDLDIILSLAGRTADPLPQPVPYRVGGFGGSAGLATYLIEEAIDLLVDATHPFAVRISANAVEAAATACVPALALRRPAWSPVEGDIWHSVPDVASAIEALGRDARRVFMAIGRQEAHHANAAPWHRYIVRSVDPVDPPLTALDVTYVNAIGPFSLAAELELLRQHAIDAVITKNSGGDATYAKIEAARRLGIEVIMVERSPAAEIPTFATMDTALAHIDHLLAGAMKRGV